MKNATIFVLLVAIFALLVATTSGNAAPTEDINKRGILDFGIPSTTHFNVFGCDVVICQQNAGNGGNGGNGGTGNSDGGNGGAGGSCNTNECQCWKIEINVLKFDKCIS